MTSGKFNSYFPLLGFDAVKNERGEYTGIYKPNKKELKQVEWIMSSFLRVDRYKVLLDLCKSRVSGGNISAGVTLEVYLPIPATSANGIAINTMLVNGRTSSCLMNALRRLN